MSLTPSAPLKLARLPAYSLLPSSLYLLCRAPHALKRCSPILPRAPRIETRSLLPAALPSMSLTPSAPLKLIRLPVYSLLPSSLYLDHSHCPVLVPATWLLCRLPVRLKLVRFPAHPPLPIAALPSMYFYPKAPFPHSRRVLYRAPQALHSRRV